MAGNVVVMTLVASVASEVVIAFVAVAAPVAVAVVAVILR